MIMGERGMADMGEMVMPLPRNTLPMMTGQGQFGPIEMRAATTATRAGTTTRPAPSPTKSD
jgi:hypothetical protein